MPNSRFIIKLLTFNRLQSLSNCLESLSTADYEGDIVTLHIFVDHFEREGAAKASTIDKQLQEAHELLHYIDSFNWPHGQKEIHYRTQNAGLQGQWLEAWWPASDDEFAFVVEDDMRVSPLFYRYLKQIIRTYYYDPSNYDPTVYGISLQRPRFVPGKHGNPLQVDMSTRLFLYQLVGTWGQLLFPRPWKEFRIWYDIHRSKDLKPLLEGMVTTGWYNRSRERIWTPWFIKFVNCKGYFNLYTNFVGGQALSVSYREKGVNTKRKAGPDSKLIENHRTPEINLWDMRPLKKLKRYNYCFHEVSQGRLVRNFDELSRVLPSLQMNGAVILVNTLGFSEVVFRNWLCQFNKFGKKNHLLLLQNQTLLEEFSLKGYAVMHVSPDKDQTYGHHFEKFAKGGDELTKQILTIVQAMTWVLQAGYNVWLTKVDTLWAADPIPGILKSDVDMIGFAAGKGISTKLLYCKSSEETLRLWKIVWNDILHQARASMSNSLSDIKHEILEASLGEWIPKSKVKLKFLAPSLIANIVTASRNQTHSMNSPVPLLTGIETSDLYTNLLKDLGLWMIDDELACTGVFCR